MTPRRPVRPARIGEFLNGVGPFVGSGLSVAGLILVAFLSLGLLTGDLPLPNGGGSDGDGAGPIRTPTPSGVIVIDPRTLVPGTMVYAKTGNIWIQSGDHVYRLTYQGQDSMPSWSPDGKWIYFIRDVPRDGQRVMDGVLRTYHLEVPTVMRIGPDSDAPPETIVAGLYQKGSTTWSYFIRQPVLSPDQSRIVVVSDGLDATKSDVVLQFFDPLTGALTPAGLAENRPLGHQDPAWSPDGTSILYVKNGRDGSRGAPVIMRYTVVGGTTSVLAGPGYVQPDWSPDGRFVAATRTDGFGTDVVILDGITGIELLRITNDGASFAPAWSPAGDAPDWTLGGILPLTDAAGLDAGSRPDWYIPPEQLPVPTPSPTPIPTDTPAATSGASSLPARIPSP